MPGTLTPSPVTHEDLAPEDSPSSPDSPAAYPDLIYPDQETPGPGRGTLTPV